jgi:hypothetical protein
MHCTISIKAHVCAYAIDHVEPESEIKKEQAQEAWGGSQASSCEDGNIIMIKASPDELINAPCLLLCFESCFIFYYDCVLSL